MATIVATSGHDICNREYGDVVDVRSCAEPPIVVCATKSAAMAQSQTLIGVLETAMESLKEVGAQAVVAQMVNDIRKGGEGRVLSGHMTQTYCSR